MCVADNFYNTSQRSSVRKNSKNTPVLEEKVSLFDTKGPLPYGKKATALLKKLKGAKDPSRLFEKTNRRRIKSGLQPFPVSMLTHVLSNVSEGAKDVGPKSKASVSRSQRRAEQRIDDLLMGEDTEVTLNDLDKVMEPKPEDTEKLRQLHTGLKKLRKSKLQRKRAKVQRGKKAQERNRRQKQMHDHRDGASELLGENLSFEGMERRAQVKERQKLRKAKKQPKPQRAIISNPTDLILEPEHEVVSSKPSAVKKKYTKKQKAAHRAKQLRKKRAKRRAKMERRALKKKNEMPSTESSEVKDDGLTLAFNDLSVANDPVWLSLFGHNLRTTITFVYQLKRARNGLDIAACVMQFLHTTDYYHESRHKDIFTDKLENWSRNYFHRPEAESNILEDATQMLTLMVSSEIVQLVKEVLMSIVSLRWFNRDLSKGLIKLFGKASPSSIVELVHVILRMSMTLLKIGRGIVAGEDVLSALFSENPLGKAFTEVEFLEKMADYTYCGLPYQGGIEIHEYVARVDKTLDMLAAARKGDNPFKPMIREIEAREARLLTLKALKQIEIQAKTRTPPSAVVLHGTPGIGKGYLLKYIAQVWANAFEIEWVDGLIYSKDHSEYWANYNPMSQRIIHYSEVGKYKDKIAIMKVDRLGEITSIVDSRAYAVNMPFDKKGKVYATPGLVLMDTNNPDMNLGAMYAAPSAYKRRFIYIDVHVKPQFCKEGTGMLDTSKSAADVDSHILDRYNFVIYMYEAKDNNEYARVELLSTGSLAEFSSFMRKMFIKHSMDNRHVQKRLDADGIIFSEPIADEVKVADDGFPLVVDPRDEERERRLSEPVAQSESSVLEHPVKLWQAIQECSRQDVQTVARFLCFMLLASLCSVTSPAGHIFRMLLLIIIAMFSFKAAVILILLCSFLYHYFGPQVVKYLEQLNYWLHAYAFLEITDICNISLRRWVRRAKIHALENTSRYAALATAAAATLAVIKVIKLMSEPKPTVEMSAGEKLNVMEEEFGVLPLVREHVPVQGSNVWNIQRVHPTFKTLHRSGLSSLAACAARNVRYVHVVHDNLKEETHIMGIRGNVALINEHVFRGRDSVVLHIAVGPTSPDYSSGWRTLIVRRESCALVTSDVLAFTTVGINFTDVAKHLPPSSLEARYQCKGHVGNKTVALDLHPRKMKVMSSQGVIELRNYIAYSYAGRSKGFCGLPITAEIGDGSALVGVHAAGVGDSDEAFGVYITKPQVERAIGELMEKTPFVTTEAAVLGTVPNVLHPPIRKSMTRFEDLRNLAYYGKVPGPVVMNTTSKLRHSKIAHRVDGLLRDDLEFKDFKEYLPPPMRPFYKDGKYYNPYNIGLKRANKKKKALDSKLLVKIKNELIDRIVTMLKSEGVTKLSPLSHLEAINGVEGNPFIKRVNASTGSGFGMKGPKSNHLILQADGVTRKPTPELAEALLAATSRYREGKRNHFVYSVQLKDEPRSKKKVAAGKTRLFYATPLPLLIIARQFLAPFYSLMVRFPHIFCTAVGVDMQSEGGIIYEAMVRFVRQIIEGDYAGYDLEGPYGVSECSAGVIYGVLELLGYNLLALIVVRALLTDGLFPYIEILGDIFCVPGLQPSGKYGTAEDNSLKGLIMLMYAYYSDHPDGNFFDDVLPLTYGDDVIAASINPEFNSLYYSDFCDRVYGMKFTTASKEEVEKPFITPDEMSLLKRHFMYSNAFGMVIAPLPIDTVRKALQWVLPSAVSERDQMLSTAISMSREFALIDASRHERFRLGMISMLVDTYGFTEDYVRDCIPHLSTVVNSIRKNLGLDTSKSPGEGFRCGQVNVTNFLDRIPPPSPLDEPHTESGISRLAEYKYQESAFGHVHENMLNLQQYAVELRTAYEGHRDYSRLTPGVPLALAIRESNISKEFREMVEEYGDVVLTLRMIRRNLRRQGGMISQFPEMPQTESSEVKEENLGDEFGTSEVKVDSGENKASAMNPTVLTLDDFFGRPVEIASFNTALGADVNLRFPVWDLYTINPTIRAKLRNYAYFRANLHIRVAISGSPFHYGRILCSPQPYAASNANLNELLSSIISFPTMRPLLINYLSQSPGSVVMDVNANQPSEITMPFVSAKPAHRLYSNTGLAISDVTSFPDLANAWDLFVYTINPVLSTSATPSNVRVQIYAWATEVELGTTTATVLEVTTESAVIDERETGPIEEMSSALADASGRLSAVPAWTPWALPSQMFFSTVGRIASIFGWSRPALIEEPSFVKNNPYANGALTIGSETTHRLVLDPKQELAMCNSFGGETHDDMVISKIAGIPTYLTTFTWSESDLPFNVIWQSRVNPRLETWDTGAIHTFSQPTAMAFAVAPFSVWNGNIRFRLEVVVSKFHRGKLAVLYEPNISQYSLITANLTTNKNFLCIIDLEKTQTIDFRVNWAAPRLWATVEEHDTTTVQYGPSMDAIRPEYTNGYIAVVPFTALQSPDNSDVSVNVYTYCPDLRVNYMTSVRLPEAREIRTESAVIAGGENMCELNDHNISLDRSAMMHYGELPVSFRSLLKRYSTGEVSSMSGGTATNGSIRYVGRVFPVNGLKFGDSAWTEPKNLFSYLMYAYLGIRGSVRKRIHFSGELGDSQMEALRVVKVSNGSISASEATSLAFNSGLPLTTMEGGVTFAPSSNGGIEFEIPFYSQNIFAFSFADDLIGENNDGEYLPYWNKRYHVHADVHGTYSTIDVSVESAAGEDFSFLRFQGAPYHTY